MKNKIMVMAALIALVTIQFVRAQIFDGSHPGYMLVGKTGVFDGSFLTGLQGNAQSLTNFSGLTITNSSTTYLTTGLAATTGAMGLLSVTVSVTNSQIVWLTNNTSHLCTQMGNTAGVWTNYDNASMLCSSNDSVLVTNIAGAGGATLISSFYQVIR